MQKKFIHFILLVFIVFTIPPVPVNAVQENSVPEKAKPVSQVLTEGVNGFEAYVHNIQKPFFYYLEPGGFGNQQGFSPKRTVVVYDETPNGWAYVNTINGPMWIQLGEEMYFQSTVYDLYDEPDGNIVMQNCEPGLVCLTEVQGNWYRIEGTANGWISFETKKNIVFEGNSWNQYEDDENYEENTYNACELYATASAMNSLQPGYIDHPIDIVRDIGHINNPYNGFNSYYGIYAKPLTDYINRTYRKDYFSYNATGFGIDAFEGILARNGRILVWLNTGTNRYGYISGIRVLFSSHTVAVMGIDDTYVYITDSMSLGGVTAVSRQNFERSFTSYYPDKNQAVILTNRENKDNMMRYISSYAANESS